MDYAIFKEAVLVALEDGPLQNMFIRLKLVAMGHQIPIQQPSKLDRLLRKMRDDGLIMHQGNKWHTNKFIKCTKCGGKGFHDPDPIPSGPPT